MKRATLAISVLALATAAWAQEPMTGMPPFGSFDGADFDVVNLQNLNVHFSIPTVSSPGRGMDLTHAIVYDGLAWKRAGAPSAWTPVADSDGNPLWGWKADAVTGSVKFKAEALDCVTAIVILTEILAGK